MLNAPPPDGLMPRRWIAHLDMDAFYASVELLRYPMLRGQAVVIGGGSRHAPQLQADGQWHFSRLRDYVGRGVVTTATYEARALGVHSAMGTMKAAALAPEAILLPTDFERYREQSHRFKAAVAALAPLIEDRGIDEIYIDLSDLPGAQGTSADDPYAGVRQWGRRLKVAVHEATGLNCSVGITPNKLLSKLSSELDKPDGLTVLTHVDIPSRLWPLPAQRINGIGPKAAARLSAHGIRTIGDLAQAALPWLVDEFGTHYGTWLHAAARGEDTRPLVTSREAKSISRETTFERDLHPQHDREALGALLTHLCERLAADLQRKNLWAGNIGVKLRYSDFRIASRELTLATPTANAQDIRRWAGHCLKRVPLNQRLRLLGVRAGRLGAPTPPPSSTECPDGDDSDAQPIAPPASRHRRPLAPPPHATLPLFDSA